MIPAKHIISSALAGVVATWGALAFSATSITSRSCPVVGLKPLKVYAPKSQTRCFRSAKSAVAGGFTPYNANSTKSKARSSRTPRSSNSCKFVGVKSTSTFFSLPQISCFKSVRAATRKRFGPLAAPTPAPTTAPTPAATPTPDANTARYTFQLGEAHPGSGYLGSCTADLNGLRTEINISCTHNVLNVTEAHLHIAPTNDPYCVLPNPGLSFTMTCSVSSEEAQRILDGSGFVAVHNGPDVAGEAAVGLIRNS